MCSSFLSIVSIVRFFEFWYPPAVSWIANVIHVGHHYLNYSLYHLPFIVTAGLGEEQVTVKTTRGCPQGRVLSPLLWSLVIDELLNDLDRQGYEVIGFADDLVITVRGNNDSILSEIMQSALS
jgi:Reverse transcriptase (RNA-dependent DNA polymerase)